MLVSGLSYTNSSQINKDCQKTEKKNTIKKSESTQSSKLEETIIEMAKKDASRGKYMGAEFISLQRNLVSKVSPNRSSAIAQVSNLMENKNGYNLIDGINRWLAMLLNLPYKAEGTSRPFGHNTAQIYDQNGEMIASYHWESGWTSVPTSAETKRGDELKFMYYDAYCEAREAMKAENTSNTGATSGTLFNAQA